MKCPHCLATIHSQISDPQYIASTNESIDGVKTRLSCHFRSYVCPSCEKLVLFLYKSRSGSGDKPLEGQMIYPKGMSRNPTASEIPDRFAKDYSEACLVLADSAKASAALSRRCLQNLLRDKAGVNRGTLDNEIQQVLDSKSLPSHLSEAIDSVRVIGDFAAHPIKSTHSGEIFDAEPGEAEWLLDTLEGLFDFYFVQPAILQKKREALNKKLAETGKSNPK